MLAWSRYQSVSEASHGAFLSSHRKSLLLQKRSAYVSVEPLGRKKRGRMVQQKSRQFIVAAILVLSFLSGCGGSTPVPISEGPTASSTPEPLTPNPIQPMTSPMPTSTPEAPVKILFIGNSLTYENEGLDIHFKRLVDSSDLPLNIETERVVKPSAPLESLWKNTNAREAINEGDYDLVVLQEDMPLTDVETFHEYARKFDAEIKEAGAETVLFMAWPHKGAFETGEIAQIAQAHRDIAAELGVDVVPVCLAWQRAMEELPEVDVYTPDDVHPSVYGTYLAVNVVYATVFGESPVGLAYVPPDKYFTVSTGEVIEGMSEEAAASLQRIAWQTVQEYQAQQ
jgi:hypothetical protein